MLLAPNSGLEPSVTAKDALQLTRIMLLPSMRSHEPEVVRNRLRTWIIFWPSQGSSQTLTGFFTHVDISTTTSNLMANPSTERLATRSTNANQHPGLLPKRPRRTKEEMARDRALLEEKKAENKRQQDKGIERIAELEDRMAIDDAGAEGAHPRNRKGTFVMLFFCVTELLIQNRC